MENMENIIVPLIAIAVFIFALLLLKSIIKSAVKEAINESKLFPKVEAKQAPAVQAIPKDIEAILKKVKRY